MHTNPHATAARSPDDPSPQGLLIFAAFITAVLLVMSYPLYSIAVAALAGVMATLAWTLADHLASYPDRVRTVRLPGVGTIRFTVSPR